MDVTQATIATAWVGAIQASSAILMLCVSIWIAYLTRKQNNNAKLQTQYMRTQIDFSLYKKRYAVYTCLKVFISDVMKIPIPKRGENTDDFLKKYEECKIGFWQGTCEKEFLFDDTLNIYIDSIEKKVGIYFTVLVTEFPPLDRREYGEWLVKIDKERINLTPLFDEMTRTFTECMSYKKLLNEK